MNIAQAQTNYVAAHDVADADGFHHHGVIDLHVDDMIGFIAGRRHNRQSLAPRQQTLLDLINAGF